MNIIRKCLLAMMLVLPVCVFAADTETLAADCDGCHGPQGVSSDSDIPTIAGQSAKYIKRTLDIYQDWGRPCIKSAYRHGDTSKPVTSMCQISEGMSDEEIEAVSQYYAAQEFVAAKQDFDPANVALGEQMHEVLCENCHLQNGKDPEKAPRLAGQWSPYLKEQLRLALTGEHLVPPMMEKRLSEFSPEEIDALMNFYASGQ